MVPFEYNKSVFPDFPENPLSTKFTNPPDFVWLRGLLVGILRTLVKKKKRKWVVLDITKQRSLIEIQRAAVRNAGDFCEASSALSFSLSCRYYHIPGGHRFWTRVYASHLFSS